MTLCAWALDDSEAQLHSERRNREHVLGQQFQPLVRGGASYSAQRIHLDAEDRTQNQHMSWPSNDPTSWVTRAFCDRCNGGWMAALDNAARPIVERLITTDEVVELNGNDRATLASWAFKLSIGFEHVGASTDQHDPTVLSQFFHAQTAPAHAAVAAGKVSFTYANALYGVRTGHLQVPGVGPTRVFSLLLRHVVIQVSSSCHGKQSVPPLDLLPLRRRARTVFHPLPTSEMNWPPEVLIDTEQSLVQVVSATAPFPAE